MRKLCVAHAGNTAKYALAAIYAKGYKVFLYPFWNQTEGCNDQEYYAIKDGRHFVGHEPEIVLGLIAIWEQFGDKWLETKVPDHQDRLYEQTYPDDEYESLDEESFQKLVDELRIFFDAIEEPMPEIITKKSLAKFMLNFSEEIEKRANEE